MLIDTLREQYMRLSTLDDQIKTIEERLQQWLCKDEACRRVASIPGVGLLTATAIIATMGDPGIFKSAREFAA